MQMLYQSDAYVVLRIDTVSLGDGPVGAGTQQGFEIVDKAARKGIYLGGDVARSFERGVRELADRGPVDPDSVDEFIAGYVTWAHQPLVLH